MRNVHAGLPFTAAEFSDEQLAAALEDLSVPALLVSCVHMSRPEDRAAILASELRPQGSFLNEYQGFLDADAQARARAFALDVVRDWRDRGCPEPEPVSPAMVKQLMEWIVGAAVGDEYVPLVLEELELDGADERAGAPVAGAADYPVVIIGAGMSGILAAIRVSQAGFPFVIVEKNAGPGGTWWENSYPGARVDVGSHFYCYSFEPADHWTEFFPQQPEVQAYFQGVFDKHGLGDHTRFSTEVVGATWDEAAGTWSVELDTGESLVARAVVAAVGQMNRPFVPDVPGGFDGPAFHTARWDHDVDVTGKRVVMVGAGATGFQVAPAIADQVKSLTVLQRTAQWMFPNPGYHDRVGPGVGWAIRHLPFYGRWFRFLIFWPSCDAAFAAAKVDPDWEPQATSVSEINDIVRTMFSEWITSQLPDDPELVAKVVPDYPATGKRTLQDNGSWLQTLSRDNVTLVRAGVDRLEADGVVDDQGELHPADVVVWATGFRVNDFLLPLRIIGRDGQDLRETWGSAPRAHLGVTVSGFPNLFLLYGPNTNLASGGSIIFASECEVTFMVECLRLLAESGSAAIEPTRAAYDDWYERVQAEAQTMVWASPHIEHNYYKNAEGDVHGINPFRIVDYWGWTRRPDPADYQLS
ncbi:NAD(P)/FAD-dependent oxidoreductase [Nocardioides sp. SR21]|uniref:flavin-containing monooxygenase n=1 Tax=Nocardioides sp. SR21 TaxID=2919501 RepID=UPI001FAAA599|nr:NAD(P)/FAD-dependent oxidoreductase [Nocardioides sp. SR21]